MGTPTRWSSRTAFVFATAAAAIGLGNIWRFPYLAGQNGGGTFVLLYLFFIITLGIPLMTSEMLLGRLGRKNPVGALSTVAQQIRRSRHWRMLGGLTVLAGFLILSYYLVITGWVLDYFARSLTGEFYHATEASALHSFALLKSSPWQMLASDTLMTCASVGVILLGIKKGLERAVLFMFPTLLVLMLLLLGYAITTGSFYRAVVFLFHPHFQSVTSTTVLLALGQAFFSLNIAMGVIIMFSAYLPNDVSIPKSVAAVAIADTLMALLAGLIIFPIVFDSHLKISAGPSLIFETLPIAFGHMPWGNIVGPLFFLLLLFAAFTSAISLLETTVAWLMEQHHTSRRTATVLCGATCWLLSLGTIFSFSHSVHWQLFGVTFYQAIDFLTAGLMLPIGGLLIAFFTGWLLPAQLIHEQLGWNTLSPWFRSWRFIKRYFAPLAILFILLTSLGVL